MQGLMDLFGMAGQQQERYDPLTNPTSVSPALQDNTLFGVDIDDPRMKMAVENLQAKSNGGKHASMGMNAPAAPQAGLGSDIGLRGLMGSTALQQINNPQRQQFQRNRSNIRSLMGG